MKLVYLDEFLIELANLPMDIQKTAVSKLGLFEGNILHPSLRTRKMSGKHRDVWEGHITMKYVFTFTLETEEGTGEAFALLRRIGTHEIYKKP